MQFTTTVLTTLSLLATTAFAADCAGAQLNKPNMDIYWTARSAACHAQTLSYEDPRVLIAHNGPKPKKSLCWDATKNILQQCISQGYQLGYYNYDGTTYRVARK